MGRCLSSPTKQQQHEIQIPNHIRKLQLDLQRLEQDINTKKEAILQMEAKIKDDKEKEKRNIQQLKKKQTTIDQLQGDSDNLEKDKRKLQQQLKTKRNQVVRLQTLLNNKKIGQARQQADEQAALKQQIMQKENQIRKKQNGLRDVVGRLENINQQKKKLEVQYQNRQNKLRQNTESYNQLNRELQLKQRQLQMIQKTMYQLIEQEKRIQAELNFQKKQLRKQQQQIRILGEQKTRVRQGLQLAKKKIEQSKVPVEQSSTISPLFTGEVLLNCEQQKYFLINVLQNKLKRKIQSTKLIYRYDELNRVNFHKYIDNNSQLVIVIKLVNRYLLAAWAEGSFYPRMASDKDGLIFSLTNRKVFSLKQKNRRAITYDDFFLIVGNSQVRLKSQDKKLFSNFGLNNSYYDNCGQKVNFLLGAGADREVEMQAFEVFQLGI